MRSLLLLVPLLFLLLGLGACTGSGVSVADAEAPERTPVPEFLMKVLQEQPAMDYAEVVAALGPPIRVQASAMPEASSPSDTLRRVHYYGLEIWLHEAAPHVQVTRLAVTDARHETPMGLRVGYARPTVIRTLGRPLSESTTEMIYEQAEPVPVKMVLFFERRAISRIEWRFD